MASTVRDIVTLFDALAGQGAKGSNPDTKITLLNSGKDEFWKILVGSNPQENWFLVESQSATPANDDYFPPLTASARSYALPPNFHQMRYIEVVDSGFKHLRFEKGNLDTGGFRQLRSQTTTSFDSEVLYDIVGTNPGSLLFALLPPSAMTLTLGYIRKPTKWAALTDTAPDEFPESSHELIAEWAVKRTILGVGDRRFIDFEREWQERVARWMRVYRRDNTGPDVVEGFFEGF
jgi:hypothetical protein